MFPGIVDAASTGVAPTSGHWLVVAHAKNYSFFFPKKVSVKKARSFLGNNFRRSFPAWPQAKLGQAKLGRFPSSPFGFGLSAMITFPSHKWLTSALWALPLHATWDDLPALRHEDYEARVAKVGNRPAAWEYAGKMVGNMRGTSNTEHLRFKLDQVLTRVNTKCKGVEIQGFQGFRDRASGDVEFPLQISTSNMFMFINMILHFIK